MMKKHILIIFLTASFSLGLLIYVTASRQIDLLSASFISGTFITLNGYYLAHYFYKNKSSQ